MTAAALAGRPQHRRSNLGLVAHQIGYEQLSFWRNPQSAIFTFLFPVLFVTIMGALFGSVGTSSYFTGLLAHCVLVSLVDIALIVGVGRLYGVPLPSQWAAITLTLVLAAASFCALGVAVASVISNAEAAPAVAQLVLFPLLFLSGTYMPIHSQLLNQIAGWLPVRPFNEALTGPLSRHTGADWRHLAVLAAWGAGGAIVAVRRFRWNPRPE